eukprot:COSAG01_NODE_1233_length_11110_cov_13.006902_1_plen_319_part_00
MPRPPRPMPIYQSEGDSLTVHGGMLEDGQTLAALWPHAQLLATFTAVGHSGTPKLRLPLQMLLQAGGSSNGSGSSSRLALFFSSNSSMVRYYAAGLPIPARKGTRPQLDLVLRVAFDPVDPQAWHKLHALPPFMALDAASVARCVYGDSLCLTPDLQSNPECGAAVDHTGHASRAEILELLLAPTSCRASVAAAASDDTTAARSFRCGALTNDSDVCAAALEGIRYHCDPRAHGPTDANTDVFLGDHRFYLDLCDRIGCRASIGRALGRANECQGVPDSRQGSDWVFPTRMKLSVLLGLCSDEGKTPLDIPVPANLSR